MNHTKFARAQCEHKQLLLNLKCIAETFLNSKLGESWISSGALLRLHTSIEQIFINGIRVFKPDGLTPDCWRFIEGLNWLNPSLTISIANRSCSPTIHIPYARIKNDNALTWIYESLESHSLSQKLKYLLSDNEHLNTCYEVTAFLQNEKYVGALLLCLKAIENNQPNLLTQIDVTLYKSEKSQHKRSTSHPDFSFVPRTKVNLKSSTSISHFINKHSSLDHSRTDGVSTTRKCSLKPSKEIQLISLKLRPWASLPDVNDNSQPHRIRSNTMSQPIHIPNQNLRSKTTTIPIATSSTQKVPSFTYKQNASDSGSNGNNPSGDFITTPSPSQSSSHISQMSSDLMPISLVKCDDIKIHFDRKYRAKEPKMTVNNKSPFASDNFSYSPSELSSLGGCFNDNKNLLTIMAHNSEKTETVNSYSAFGAGSAPADFVNEFIPKEGEKIQNRYGRPNIAFDDSFRSPIGSQQRPKQGQSLTSFLQAAQFSRANTELERENAHFSVSEAMISAIEQIKWRRLQETKDTTIGGGNIVQRKLKSRRQFMRSKSSSNTKAKSVESSSDGESSGDSRYSPNELLATNLNQSQSLSESTQSMNDHKAYAEWGDNMDNLSAESVALSLISKFNDKQLPKASDLMWLVSEQDAPQQMLPMPGSWTVSPDEIYKIPFTRGTRDWAPPRAQIIFTRHPPPDRKKLLHKQNQKCAGCGMKVAAAFSHRFRYCEYIGKYHCSGCHRNQISVIPARVLDRWDFTLHPVSVFSYRLLDQIWTFPVFRVSDLNAELYEKVRILRFARLRRVHLKFVKDFITTCRFADHLISLFDGIEKYLTNDTDLWSMTDFVAVRNGSFLKNLSTIIAKCDEHIKECELCTARGFLCELCPQKQVIFPWQPKIRRCNDCGACYHENCWQNECNKCQRLKKRQQSSGARKI